MEFSDTVPAHTLDLLLEPALQVFEHSDHSPHSPKSQYGLMEHSSVKLYDLSLKRLITRSVKYHHRYIYVKFKFYKFICINLINSLIH